MVFTARSTTDTMYLYYNIKELQRTNDKAMVTNNEKNNLKRNAGKTTMNGTETSAFDPYTEQKP